MAGYATSGRGWHNPAVAGLLRRDERVHAQSIELADCLCRVIASIGVYIEPLIERYPALSNFRMAGRLGKIPATSVRRRISLLRRSRGLLDRPSSGGRQGSWRRPGRLAQPPL